MWANWRLKENNIVRSLYVINGSELAVAEYSCTQGAKQRCRHMIMYNAFLRIFLSNTLLAAIWACVLRQKDLSDKMYHFALAVTDWQNVYRSLARYFILKRHHLLLFCFGSHKVYTSRMIFHTKSYPNLHDKIPTND